MKHHFLTPLQNAVPHVQSKQSLKLFFSESVDCLVCSDEDLRRNILTDFASINWLTVSTYIYTLHDIVEFMRQDGYCDLLSEGSTVLQLILVLPATNAECERCFSCLKRVKTYLKNALSQKNSIT